MIDSLPTIGKVIADVGAGIVMLLIEICKNLYIQVLLFNFVSSAITIDSRIGEHKK